MLSPSLDVENWALKASWRLEISKEDKMTKLDVKVSRRYISEVNATVNELLRLCRGTIFEYSASNELLRKLP